MKTSNLLLATLVLTSGLLFNAHAQSWVTNGLAAFYPFSGDAKDASGNGNHGTVTAAALAVDRLGNPNSAYAFDGVSSLITVPDAPSLKIAGDITVTCWLQFSEAPTSVRLLGKGVQCGKNYGLQYDSGCCWMFQQFPPQGGCVGCQENTDSANPSVILGKWYHMVGVRSGSVARLYLDGIKVKEEPVCSSTIYTGNESLLIGGTDPAEIPASLMHGSLDDIRIYNRALSSNEVTQLYAIEYGPRVDLIKAVKPLFSNLATGTNYQLQISGNLNNWTNQGSAFTATNTSMVYPQYWDVDNWGSLFFRLQVTP